MPTNYPRLEVYIDNKFIPGVISARVQRGMDQEMATCVLTCKWPLPSYVVKWSKVVVLMGTTPDNFKERFVGWLLSFGESLFPGREVLNCGDEMALLKNFYPLEDVDFDGMTDQQIIVRVLKEVGVPASRRDIQGTGKKIGGLANTKGLHWAFTQSALDVVKEIDSFSLGYRTFCEASGIILRRKVREFPGANPAFTFTEGTDIVTGSATFEQVDPKTQVNVLGGKGAKSKVVDPNDSATWRSNPWWKLYRKLQKQATDINFHSTDEVAAWIFARLNRNLIRGTITTYRDDFFGMLATCEVDSEHIRLDGGVSFWLQSITTEIDSSGRFRQNLGLVTEWHFPTTTPPTVGNPPGGGTPGGGTGGGSGGTGGTNPPGTDDITADFAFSIAELETVLVGGVPTSIFTVVCSDLSTTQQGTITVRNWAATGNGVVVGSGTGKTFTTGFSGAGGTITLTVTNSLGFSKVVSRNVSYVGGGEGLKARKLYASTTTTLEAFDGSVWRSYSPSTGVMTALAPGPKAGAGTVALSTNDDLVTPATEVTIFDMGASVSSIWIEPDVSEEQVLAGSDDGRIALSYDGGVTWQIKEGPGGVVVRRIVLSRYTLGQIHCVTDTGYYVSDNYGDGWREILSGSFEDIVLSHQRNVVVTTAGGMKDAVSGADFTFPVLVPAVSLRIVQPNIREDRFYAIDSQGRTFYTTTNGGIAHTQGASIPAGSVDFRGGWRDGSIVDVVYFATSNGLYKTADGFKTLAGYLKLRD